MIGQFTIAVSFDIGNLDVELGYRVVDGHLREEIGVIRKLFRARIGMAMLVSYKKYPR